MKKQDISTYPRYPLLSPPLLFFHVDRRNRWVFAPLRYAFQNRKCGARAVSSIMRSAERGFMDKEPDLPPPIFGTWGRFYAVVVANTLVTYLLLVLFSAYAR